MKHLAACVLVCLIAAALGFESKAGGAGRRPTVRCALAGPFGTVIRMGWIPRAAMNAGKQVIQKVAADGSLANVRPPEGRPSRPAEPVVIDQRACVYGPRS